MTVLRAGTLYPRLNVTVDSGAGIDIRNLDDANGATADVTTIISPVPHTADNSAYTWYPGVTAAGSGGPSSTSHKRGWAIPLSDLSTGEARCVAVLKEQTVTVNFEATLNATGGTGNLGGTITTTFRASLFRYNVSTNTATLLHDGSDTESWSTVAVTGDQGTFKAISCPIVVTSAKEFTTNEVLLIQIGFIPSGTLPNPVTGTTNYSWTLRVDQDATNVSFEGMRQRCEEAQAGSGVGSALKALVRARATRTSTGVGTGLVSKAVGLTTRFLATGVGTGASTRRVRTTDAASGVGTATKSLIRVRTAEAATGIGTGSKALIRVRTTKTATGVGTGAFSRLWEAFREATAIGVGTTVFDRTVTFVRLLTVTGIGTARARIELPIEDLPDGGAAPTVVRKFYPQGE